MKIIKQEENKLLGRTEIQVELAFTGKTPSREEIRKQIAESTKADPKMVIVRKIEMNYGENVAIIDSNVYNKLEELQTAEPAHMQKKHETPVKEGEEAVEEAPVKEAASVVEAPKEEAKVEDAPTAKEPKVEKVKEATPVVEEVVEAEPETKVEEKPTVEEEAPEEEAKVEEVVPEEAPAEETTEEPATSEEEKKE